MAVERSIHTPVLAAEAIKWLAPQPGQVILDGTLGGGGHTRLLAERVGQHGRIIALDRDATALARAETSLAGLPVVIAQSNFCDAAEVFDEIGVPQVDGVLLDLGLSSDQLADDERGFGFESEGPLDLRFDTEQGQPAWQLLARLREQELANVIYEFGEERCSRRIAKEIVARRRTEPVTSARQLAELVRRCTPRPKPAQRIHPATRTFQALRIAVNEELRSLDLALERLPDLLSPGGRLAIISFHSLEDRRVKESFRDDDRLNVLTRKAAYALGCRDVRQSSQPQCEAPRGAARRRSGTALAGRNAGNPSDDGHLRRANRRGPRGVGCRAGSGNPAWRLVPREPESRGWPDSRSLPTH